MFKCTLTEEPSGSFRMILGYQMHPLYCNIEFNSFAYRADAYRYYAWMADDYLRFRMDDFASAVLTLSRYYFDRTNLVHLFGDRWRTAYWEFRALRCSIENDRPAISEHADRVLSAEALLERLVPDSDELGRKVMTEMLEQILQAAKQVRSSIRFIRASEGSYTLKNKTA